jgi:two-component system copper resistance phosphate regulon response regulator CusR
MNILIVEDEVKLSSTIRKGLESEGYSVTVASTGEEGFFLISNQSFDLLILDVMLPGRDGVEILTALRKRDISTPVLFLTSKDSVEDRVRGLEAGADDYLVKPFAFSELVARIRALSRRAHRVDAVTRLKLADLEMDVTGHTVIRENSELVLTAREFDLLEYLLRHQGRVVSREMLARDVWKENSRHTPLDNVIDVHIARLRRKVDEPFKIRLLHTVRGVGFIVREETT